MNSKNKNKILWDCYNNLLLGEDISRIRKLLIRYDLFKRTLNIPGNIIECGVFKGAGFMYWLKLLHIFSNGEQKSVIGFDTFSSFANSLLEYEKKSAKDYVKESKFVGINVKDLKKETQNNGFKNFELIDGDVKNTIPKYVKQNPGFRISLLNLDFDTYHGTKIALENFYDLVVPGGIIVLDEYGKKGWGESDAVDEFFDKKKIKINAIQHSYQPTAFIIKE